jgi:hypothetical protein
MTAQPVPLWWLRLQALEPDPLPRRDTPDTPTSTLATPNRADSRAAHDRRITELSPARLREARQGSRPLH